MIAERQVEEMVMRRISEAFAASGIVPPRIAGAWTVADEGEVKGSGDAAAAALAVSVGLRVYDSFQSPQADIPVGLSLTVRRDACPSGREIVEMAGVVLDVLHRWNADAEALFDEMSLDSFDPAGFRLDGGEPPMYNDSAAAWMFNVSFTLRGCVL